MGPAISTLPVWGQVLVWVGINFGSSYLSRQLARPPRIVGLDQSVLDPITKVDSAAPHQIILGRTRVGGNIVYAVRMEEGWDLIEKAALAEGLI